MYATSNLAQCKATKVSFLISVTTRNQPWTPLLGPSAPPTKIKPEIQAWTIALSDLKRSRNNCQTGRITARQAIAQKESSGTNGHSIPLRLRTEERALTLRESTFQSRGAKIKCLRLRLRGVAAGVGCRGQGCHLCSLAAGLRFTLSKRSLG